MVRLISKLRSTMLCQHDDLGVGRQKKENVSETISQRVAGSGFIWFFIVCLVR